MRNESPIHLNSAGNLAGAESNNDRFNRRGARKSFWFSIHGDLHESRKISEVNNQATHTLFAFVAWTTALLLALPGCGSDSPDTSTPQKALDAITKMIEQGHPEGLAQMIEVQARDVTFDDGVTEASAIQNVKDKMSQMIAQLWRVSKKIKDRFPNELLKEAETGVEALPRGGIDYREIAKRVLGDPFGFLTQQRARMTVEDLGDGTAAILIDDEPAYGGLLTMVETSDGWRVSVPVETLRTNQSWPDTRHEWAVIASMMLGVENSLCDFEAEFDEGKIRSVREAGERVGRLVGESVVVQSVIYAMMKRKDDAPAPK